MFTNNKVGQRHDKALVLEKVNAQGIRSAKELFVQRVLKNPKKH